MTRDELITLLKKWQDTHTRLEAQMDALTAVVHMAPESPLFEAVWAAWDGYTDMLARTVGDGGDWLAYYCWECRMGENPLEVHLTDDRHVLMDSIEALADVLMFDNA
ncbi:MAG: hypothetical protein RBR77_04340 [Thauera sp.]|nr:hypothetical protein [Thauera sp.]